VQVLGATAGAGREKFKESMGQKPTTCRLELESNAMYSLSNNYIV
jgi:hypothetical protein